MLLFKFDRFLLQISCYHESVFTLNLSLKLSLKLDLNLFPGLDLGSVPDRFLMFMPMLE
ncbi:MAG: hypothetical protein IH592_15785 [Bacteroidales bacterium]|nr:hypothetical protein [Bacteroidales bacterium]